MAPTFGKSIFEGVPPLDNSGAGGARTHDLTDYESAALTD